MGTELIKEFTITTNFNDCYDNLKMSSILDLSQEIAAEHADILGCGFDAFIKDNLIWVIVRNKYEILGSLKDLKKVRIKTYPLKNKLVEYPRDYEFYNSNDELIIKGRSIWMIYDLNKKSVISTDLKIYEEGNLGVFKERIKRLPKPSPDEDYFVKNFMVTQSLLDHNMHLNNSRSLDLFIDIFNPKKEDEIVSFQVEYVNQCFLNDLLSIYKFRDGNKCYIYAFKDEELKIYYEVTLKE